MARISACSWVWKDGHSDHLLCLFHVAAEARGVALLASGACRFHERLGAIAERLVLRLVLLTDRLHLGLLRLGQVEIATKATTFASGASAFPELTVGPGTAAMVAASRGVFGVTDDCAAETPATPQNHQGHQGPEFELSTFQTSTTC